MRIAQVTVALAAVVFVAWMAVVAPRANGVAYASVDLAQLH